jgi:hypothetical protein
MKRQRPSRLDRATLVDFSMTSQECKLVGVKKFVRSEEELEEIFQTARHKLPVTRKH